MNTTTSYLINFNKEYENKSPVIEEINIDIINNQKKYPQTIEEYEECIKLLKEENQILCNKLILLKTNLVTIQNTLNKVLNNYFS